jgi:hypothetical protein
MMLYFTLALETSKAGWELEVWSVCSTFLSVQKNNLLITCASAATDPFQCAFKNYVYPFLWCINREQIKFESYPVKTRSDPQRYSKDDDDDDDNNNNNNNNNSNNSIIVFIIRLSQLPNGLSQKQHNIEKHNWRRQTKQAQIYLNN